MVRWLHSDQKVVSSVVVINYFIYYSTLNFVKGSIKSTLCINFYDADKKPI